MIMIVRDLVYPGDLLLQGGSYNSLDDLIPSKVGEEVILDAADIGAIP
jgi:hypothetical protein